MPLFVDHTREGAIKKAMPTLSQMRSTYPQQQFVMNVGAMTERIEPATQYESFPVKADD